MGPVVLSKDYSSDVVLQLIVGERVFELARTGPGYVVMEEPVELPPCDAELLMSVDGRMHRWSVFLDQGAVPFESRVNIASATYIR